MTDLILQIDLGRPDLCCAYLGHGTACGKPAGHPKRMHGDPIDATAEGAARRAGAAFPPPVQTGPTPLPHDRPAPARRVDLLTPGEVVSRATSTPPAYRDKLAALDELHQPTPHETSCAGCGQTWPCASRRILTGGAR